MNTFRCRLVTPAAALVDEQVEQAILPAWDGSMGVLPGRAAMLVKLGVGELRLDLKAGSKKYLLDGGFVRMADNELTILAERAMDAATISASEAKKELDQAEAATVPASAKDPTSAQQAINHRREVARAKVRIAAGK